MHGFIDLFWNFCLIKNSQAAFKFQINYVKLHNLLEIKRYGLCFQRNYVSTKPTVEVETTVGR